MFKQFLFIIALSKSLYIYIYIYIFKFINKILLYIYIYIYFVVFAIEAKFLDNLDRTFSTGDNKVLEVNITMPDEDYAKVLENVQVGLEDVENGTVKDYKTKSATVIIADEE